MLIYMLMLTLSPLSHTVHTNILTNLDTFTYVNTHMLPHSFTHRNMLIPLLTIL